MANHNATLLVQTDNGERLRCVARKQLGLLVAGDWVDIRLQPTGHASVVNLHPRHGVLNRNNHKGEAKPIATHLSAIVVVSAIQPSVDTLLIDSYCVAAKCANIEPIIIINKSDLKGPHRQQDIDTILNGYTALGYRCLLMSTSKPEDIDRLGQLMHRRTCVLVGQSGVGKSSIVNALLPDKNIRTTAVSQSTGLGNHTTTATTLYNLPRGGHLIDSPGVRDFSLGKISLKQLANGFIEFEEFKVHCRFGNCIHHNEPDCAVRKAFEEAKISPIRYNNYLKILKKYNGS